MKKRILAVLIIPLLVLLALELILRCLGYTPYQLPEFSFTSEPKWCFDKDSLGVVPVPGTYLVNLNGLEHTVTHGADHNRITSFGGGSEASEPKIFLYGCSYTYGQGVNDKNTYPFLLQQKDTVHRVVNLSRPGYGTIQALIHLKKSIADSASPDIVVINYAGFHEERNVLAKSYMYKLYAGYQLMDAEPESMVYPKTILVNDSLKIECRNIVDAFKPLCFRKQSALINLADKSLAFSEQKELKQLSCTKQIFRQIHALCNEHKIELVIADIESNPDSEIMKNFCESIELDYVDISPDFSAGEYRNLPYDNHPNAKAHEVYAEKLFEYLKNKGG